MKITTKLATCLKVLLVTTPLVLTPSLTALEKPAEKQQQAPKEKARDAEMADKEAPAPVEKTAMLGVGGNAVSETLSLHLGLAEKTGLTIYHVIPDSAAAKAGIENHDVITAIGDTRIFTQSDLRKAVLAQKPGDEVTVKLVHKGQAIEKKVTLGERTIPRRGEGRPLREVQGANDLLKMLQGMGGNIPEVDRKRVEAEMRKHVEDLRRQFQNGDRLELGDGIPLNRDALKLRRGIQMLGGTSVTINDKDGSVTMKTFNGKKEVIVKNQDGETVFEGPYETEQDKAAVPDNVAERIKRVDMDMGIQKGGFKLRVGPKR